MIDELEFLRSENQRSLAYIDQLLADGGALRRSLGQREKVLNSRESVVRGYLEYIASQQQPRSIGTEVATPDYKPVNLDAYKPLTDLAVGDLDRSRLLCNLISKINEVCANLTLCEEAVNRTDRSLAAILGEARSSRLRRVELREAELRLGSMQGKYPYLVSLCQGSVKAIDTAFDSKIIAAEYDSLEELAAKRDLISQDLLNLLQLLPPESRESLPSLVNYSSQE